MDPVGQSLEFSTAETIASTAHRQRRQPSHRTPQTQRRGRGGGRQERFCPISTTDNDSYRGEGVYLAGTSLVKLLRTIYLCDYFTVPDFRHATYWVLERGESVHALQRAIHTGAVPVRCGRDLAEFGVVSGALALMTNIVMAYNAGQLQKSVDAELASGVLLDLCHRALQRTGPVSYGHINFRGTYSFPVERFASRILRAAA